MRSGREYHASVYERISPAFSDIADEISQFTITSFNDHARVETYLNIFDLRALCKPIDVDTIEGGSPDLLRAVAATENKPISPDFGDLCRLHWIVLRRKAINVLELGSGFSTVVMANAMKILDQHFGSWVRDNVRCDTPFHVFSVEENDEFLKISKQRLGIDLTQYVSIVHSTVNVDLHDSRIVTYYSHLPNICPDFIYLDGPSQFATAEAVNGISLNSACRMPMAADILRQEFLLEPGTLILVDGRTQNARFLKSYLRRNWAYLPDHDGDVHYFELQEEPLGALNRKKIEFCITGQWLLSGEHGYV